MLYSTQKGKGPQCFIPRKKAPKLYSAQKAKGPKAQNEIKPVEFFDKIS